jgi:hypothetical protein
VFKISNSKMAKAVPAWMPEMIDRSPLALLHE